MRALFVLSAARQQAENRPRPASRHRLPFPADHPATAGKCRRKHARRLLRDRIPGASGHVARYRRADLGASRLGRCWQCVNGVREIQGPWMIVATPRPAGTCNNGIVYVPAAFAQQGRFQAAVAQAAQRLAPDVVSVIPTLGSDWSGEPAVFFMVILADAVSRRDQLLNISNRVSQAIVQEVQPLEQWGVLPYFNFRSQSEQTKLNQPALA
jgi:hypothetical protein